MALTIDGSDPTGDLGDLLDDKANLASPTFTGTPAGPTAAAGTDTTQLATTAFVQGANALVLLASATPASASSVIFDNVFSATYGQYLVAWRLVGTATLDLRARYRSGSPAADDTGNNYHRQLLQAGNTTIAGARFTDTFTIAGQLRTNTTGNVFIVNAPNVAVVTSLSSTNQADYSGGVVADVLLASYVSVMNTSTQYTGIKLYPDSGTFSGSITLYGIKP